MIYVENLKKDLRIIFEKEYVENGKSFLGGL